jgi:RNA polymerase sigma-70 factor (ECF subfamily)
MTTGDRISHQPSDGSPVLRPDGEWSDAALVKRVLDGDERSFSTLVERYQGVLFNLALRTVGDFDEAQDVTQTAFVKAYRNLRSFDPRHRFFSWIYRITLNESLNARNAHRSFDSIPENVAAPQPDALELIDLDERRHLLDRAIGDLPELYRRVVELRHRSELSYREIAEALDIPEKTVKSRLFSARRRLAEALDVLKPRRAAGGRRA